MERHSFCTKLCENCAFPQKFHTRKLGEITVFYAVMDISIYKITEDHSAALSQTKNGHIKLYLVILNAMITNLIKKL